MTEQDIPATVAVDHIDQTIAAIAQLRANHHGHASAVQRGMDGLTTYVARPRFLAVVSAVVAVWIGLNLLAPALGRPAIDPPPFAWLGGAVGLAAFSINPP
jgi:uncharacterized membrane protein